MFHKQKSLVSSLDLQKPTVKPEDMFSFLFLILNILWSYLKIVNEKKP